MAYYPNPYKFAYPRNNSFLHHYLQQHAALSYHFQKMHSYIPYWIPSNIHNKGNVSNHSNYSSSRSSCCSCSCCSCFSRSCSKSSVSEYEEEQRIDSEEVSDEEEYQDNDYEEDESESECEYEFNVDCILAMRAAKEELKKQEGSKDEESSDSNEGESSNSRDEQGYKSDSVVLVESDKEDFEFVDMSSMKVLDGSIFKGLGKFNKTEEKENKKYVLETLYGEKSSVIFGMEALMTLNYETLYDDEQPPLWPVLPLRL